MCYVDNIVDYINYINYINKTSRPKLITLLEKKSGNVLQNSVQVGIVEPETRRTPCNGYEMLLI